MTRTLTDIGDLHTPKGQIFNAKSSYNHSMDHRNVGSTSPGPFGSSKLQKPRLFRKKHRKDQSFNPFRAVVENQEMNMASESNVGSTGFVFGATRINDNSAFFENVPVGDMRKLKIASDKEGPFVFTGGDDTKLEEIVIKEVENKLKITSETVDNFGVGLSNEMNKLNIKENIENDATDQTLLNDKMKNMHIKGPLSTYAVNDKLKADLTSNDTSGPVFRNNVNKLGNVNKSEAGSRFLYGQTQADLPASAQDVDKGKNEFISDSIPSGFSFQAGTQYNHFTNGEAESVTSTNRPGKKVEFSFATKSDGMLMQNFGFKTPTPKGSLYKKVETRWEAAKEPRYKKKKGKAKQVLPNSVNFAQDFALRETSEENAEPSESYSPMDISPYRETLTDNTLSRETSVASDESFSLNENYGSSDSRPEVSNDVIDEDLVNATVRMNINAVDVTYTETEEVESGHAIHHDGPSEESISRTDSGSFKSAAEHLDYSTDSFVTATDNEVTSNSTIERQDNDGRSQFNVSNSEEACQVSFTFAASSVAQNEIAARQQKKKNQTMLSDDSCSSVSPTKYSYMSSPLSPTTRQPARMPEVNHETAAASMAAQEACEKWRLRGNQAYANGNLSKAEECYTQGLTYVSETETSKSCLRALMLCYSNRAATRMSLGRMREALDDCIKAVSLDPNFFRVQVRAANCYLALGEAENASKYFMKCLQNGPEVCVDRKILVEASEGLEKAQRVLECMKQCVELLQRRRQSDAELALAVISEALTISTYSEKLLEMKADALLTLRKYEEVIQLCEKTLDLDCVAAEKSASSWLWCFSKIVKSYFYLGKFEEADNFLKNQEKSTCLMGSAGLKNLEAVVPLAVTIRELLCLKAAGNAAFQSGKHGEAVEHYSAAVSSNFESRPFTAICFCNRAAAYQAMGQISDAIADCSLAIALDANYVKALSRRASLFEMIRDYGQAASDLQRLVSLLTRHMENKVGGSGSHNKISEVRQTQQKLSAMEEESRKEIPLNFYLILGVDPSAGASEIRKAYRKAALKHHPDKAGQSLARNENADDGLWKEIAEEVHRDADRLFKMIGEAYAVLSDSAKRSRYDLEEEMRNSQSRGNESSRTHMDSNNYPFERSGSRRQWEDFWKAYKGTQSKESDRSRANW